MLRRFAVCALATSLFATPALAQPGGFQKNPSAADKETARTLVATGDAKYAAGEYEAALEAYRGADLIMGVPTTGWEVARTEVALGKLLEARETAERVAVYARRKDEPAAFTAARDRARALVEDLAGRIPTLKVSVTGAPAETVQVAVDGVTLKAEELGALRPMNPGDHRVLATAPGHVDEERSVTLQERDRTVVDILLHPQPQGGGDATEEELEGFPIWGWVGAGVAVAGGIAGGVTGALSLSEASEYNDRLEQECPMHVGCSEDLEKLHDKSKTLAHVSTASFVTAGAGAAVGLAALVVVLTREDAEEPSVEPVALPGGVAARVRF